LCLQYAKSDPWVNQNENMTTKTINKFENHLLSIRAERQEMIHPNSHPIYNERQQNLIFMQRSFIHMKPLKN